MLSINDGSGRTKLMGIIRTMDQAIIDARTMERTNCQKRWLSTRITVEATNGKKEK